MALVRVGARPVTYLFPKHHRYTQRRVRRERDTLVPTDSKTSGSNHVCNAPGTCTRFPYTARVLRYRCEDPWGGVKMMRRGVEHWNVVCVEFVRHFSCELHLLFCSAISCNIHTYSSTYRTYVPVRTCVHTLENVPLSLIHI